MYDVDVVKSDAMKNPRTPRACCDLRALLETHWGFLSVQEHRGDMWIYGVDVVNYEAMKIKETLEYHVIRVFCWRHIGAIILPKSTEGRC